MFHKVTLVGHLGREPETRFTQTGSNVCSFNVATNRSYTMQNGEKREETVWFRVSAWGKLGEISQQYLAKGQLVLIEGELVADENGSPRVWTDQNGAPRASFELRATSMKMLGRRDQGENADFEVDEAPAPRAAAPTRNTSSAPARQPATPARSSTPAPAASGGNRRSTMSAPQPPANDDFGDFGPDDIPF